MNTTRIALAAATLMGLASASAIAAPLSVQGNGESMSITYAQDYTGNVVGGGAVSVSGNGRNLSIAYADPTAARPSAGTPVFLGGAEGEVAYVVSPAGMSLAQR